MQVTSKEKQFIYVFDDFAGDAFRHIVDTGNRLVVCVVFERKRVCCM